MTTKTYRLSDLKQAPKEDRGKILKLLSKKRPADPDAIKRIESRIRKFERKHGFKSSMLESKLRKGEIKSSQEFSSWLMLMRMKHRIAKS